MTKKNVEINRELVYKLARANQAIKLLRQELRKSNDSWLLYMWSLIEEEINDYRWRINPPPFPLSATHNGKSLTYEIRITDVVCIVTEGRTKYIYLNKKIKNIEGILQFTNKIAVNDNTLDLEKLCAKMDGLRFHLVPISRSAAINLKYYQYVRPSFVLAEPLPLCKEVSTIKAGGKAFTEDYNDKKKRYDDEISLQKMITGYKDKMKRKV